MPSREQLEPGVMVQLTSNHSPFTYSVARCLGTRQSISSLNSGGSYVAGLFHANPVILEKWTSLGSPAVSAGLDWYGAENGTYGGHILAELLRACSLLPTSLGYASLVPWDPVAAGYSLQKAYADMNKSALDVGVMLGELRETIAGLVNPIKALRDYTKLWNRLSKSGKRPKMSDNLNMLSGSWLEWRYGIMPLIYSIQDIIKYVEAKSLASMGKMLRAGGTTKYTKESKVETLAYQGYYSTQGGVYMHIENKYTSKVFYKLVRPLTWQETFGMDLASIPGIAWELATLSFVWDWFFGVGTWLSSLQMSDARTMLGSVTSQKSTIVADVRAAVKYLNIVPSKTPPGTLQVTYQRLDRRINQTVPMIPLVNKESLSLKRQIDSISLLWQMMPKMRR